MLKKLLDFLNIAKRLRERKAQQQQEEQLKKRIEELRKRDPFIYK